MTDQNTSFVSLAELAERIFPCETVLQGEHVIRTGK